MEYLIIGFGGFIGAISRFGVYQLEKKFFLAQFPWATLIVNGMGCLLAGFLFGYLQKNPLLLKSSLHPFLMMGFLGSFTTFSTFGLESFKLIQSQDWGLVFASVMANLTIGILSVFLGFWLSSRSLVLS